MKHGIANYIYNMEKKTLKLDKIIKKKNYDVQKAKQHSKKAEVRKDWISQTEIRKKTPDLKEERRQHYLFNQDDKACSLYNLREE